MFRERGNEREETGAVRAIQAIRRMEARAAYASGGPASHIGKDRRGNSTHRREVRGGGGGARRGAPREERVLLRARGGRGGRRAPRGGRRHTDRCPAPPPSALP